MWKAPSAPSVTRSTLRVLAPPETITPPLVMVSGKLRPIELRSMPLPAMLIALKVRLTVRSSAVVGMKPTPSLIVSVEARASPALMLV